MNLCQQQTSVSNQQKNNPSDVVCVCLWADFTSGLLFQLVLMFIPPSAQTVSLLILPWSSVVSALNQTQRDVRFVTKTAEGESESVCGGRGAEELLSSRHFNSRFFNFKSQMLNKNLEMSNVRWFQNVCTGTIFIWKACRSERSQDITDRGRSHRPECVEDASTLGLKSEVAHRPPAGSGNEAWLRSRKLIRARDWTRLGSSWRAAASTASSDGEEHQQESEQWQEVSVLWLSSDCPRPLTVLWPSSDCPCPLTVLWPSSSSDCLWLWLILVPTSRQTLEQIQGGTSVSDRR